MAINVGILGFAHGHVNAYCSQWRQHDMDVRVVTGWDHEPERAARAAEAHGLLLRDSPEALCGADVDAVVIAAETNRHAELAAVAARAGKAIVMQKPLALSAAEGESVVHVVEQTGVPFTMAWQMRVDPQNLKMKELVHGGVLGQVVMVRRRHGLATHQWGWFADSWHVDPRCNRDIWFDDAAHPVDFLYWLLGMPASVTAELSSLVNPKVPSDNGIAIFRYPDGVLAEVVCSFTCPAGENTTEIVGTEGVVIQNYGDAPSAGAPRPPQAAGLKWYLCERRDWIVSDIPSPATHGARIAGLAGPLAGFLRGRRPAIATAAEGLASMRLLLASCEAAERGQRIELH